MIVLVTGIKRGSNVYAEESSLQVHVAVEVQHTTEEAVMRGGAGHVTGHVLTMHGRNEYLNSKPGREEYKDSE